MNPFFIFLVLLGAVLLWFLLAFAYKPIGKLFSKIFKDSIDTMLEEESEDENE